MKYLLFQFILIQGLLLARDPVINFNPVHYQFITMTFESNYSEIVKKRLVFDQELKKQHLDSCKFGALHVIFIDDSEPPQWQLAYPVQRAVKAEDPLEFIEITSPTISVPGIHGTEIVPAMNRLNLQMKELKVYRAFSTIVKYSVHHPAHDPFVEIIVPILEKTTANAIIYQIAYNLVILTVILYFLGAVILMLFKHEKSHLLFALFMFSMAMTKWDWLHSGLRYTLWETFPHLFYLGEPFAFLLAPSLFMTVLSVTRKNFRFKAVHSLHMIPFILSFIVFLIRFYHYPVPIKQELILSGIPFSTFEQRFGMISVHLQMIGYISAAFFVIRRYQKEIPNHQASILSRQISWFYVLLAGLVIVYYLGFIKHVLFQLTSVVSEIFYVVTILSTLVLVMIILYHIIRHPGFFSIVDTNLVQHTKKYSLSARLFETYKARLLKYIKDNKPYLDSELTLQKLSEQVSIPQHSLSEVINRGFNQNFFEFINTYRINEAKTLLVQSGSEKTILEIVYEVGYNNKSVFNAVFKKHTHKTPTEYRLQMVE